MVTSLARPLSSTCKLSCRASRLEIRIITKGNMRVLHDMMGKLPTVEVPLTKSSLQYTQRGSNPVPIPGSHQASVCVGNPVEILMFSATDIVSRMHTSCGVILVMYSGLTHLATYLNNRFVRVTRPRRPHASARLGSQVHGAKRWRKVPID